MIDPSAQHADPFGEAASYSSQRAAQMVSLVAAASEVAVRRRALLSARQAARDEQQRRWLQEQENAVRAEVRARWAPAFDPRWLVQADLLQAGRAWGAAVPYADTDPEAAAALRRAEERLRTLHPYAMTHYDRLRSEGTGPLDAMREAVHLFAREPHARPGQRAPARPAVEAGPGLPSDPAPEPGAAQGYPGQPTSQQDPYQEAERRGRAIVERLKSRALHEHGTELSPAELATALEASTTLPYEVITRLARTEAEGRLAATAEAPRSAHLGHATTAPSTGVPSGDLRSARRDTLTADTASAHVFADRTAAQLAAESFPCTASDGIRATAADRVQPTQSAHRTVTAQNVRCLDMST